MRGAHSADVLPVDDDVAIVKDLLAAAGAHGPCVPGSAEGLQLRRQVDGTNAQKLLIRHVGVAQTLCVPAARLAVGIGARAHAYVGAGPDAHSATCARIDDRCRYLSNIEKTQRAVAEAAARHHAEAVSKTAVHLRQDESALLGLREGNLQHGAGEQRDAYTQDLARTQRPMQSTEGFDIRANGCVC